MREGSRIGKLATSGRERSLVHETRTDFPHYVIPKFQPLQPGERPSGGFTQVFNRVIDECAPIMTDVALRVYLLLARRADPRNGYTVEIGYAQLAKLANRSTKSIQRGVSELVDVIKCIGQTREGFSVEGSRQTSAYQMLALVEDPFPKTHTVDSADHSQRGLRSRVSLSVVTPDHRQAPVHSQGCPPSSNRSKRTTTGRGTARNASVDAAVALLEEREFKKADAVALVEEHGATQAMVGVAIADHTKAKGKLKSSYRGLVVKAVENGWKIPAEIADEQRAAQQREEQAQQATRDKKARETEQQRIERERDEDAALVNSVTDPTRLKELYEQALQKYVEEHVRYLYAKKDPRKSQPVQGMIARYMRENKLT